MDIEARPLNLKLTVPFRISRGVQHISENVIVQVTHNDIVGLGEASPAEYYGESPGTVLACMAQFAGNLDDDPFLIEDIFDRLDHIIGLNPAAKAAIDMPRKAKKRRSWQNSSAYSSWISSGVCLGVGRSIGSTYCAKKRRSSFRKTTRTLQK